MQERLIALLTNAKFYAMLFPLIGAILLLVKPEWMADPQFERVLGLAAALVTFTIAFLAGVPQGQAITKRVTVRLKGTQ